MLTYALVVTINSNDNDSSIKDGIRTLAEIVHSYNIPITWVMSPKDVRSVADSLTNWRQDYGDDVVLMLSNFGNIDLRNPEQVVTLREKIPDQIVKQRDQLQNVLNWVDSKIIGASRKNHILVSTLVELGFDGLWGYGLSEEDYGAPFSLFYPSIEHHNFGGLPASEIVAIPFSSTGTTDFCDLLLGNTIHEPLDLYRSNLEWNSWLGFVQQVDASKFSRLSAQCIDLLDSYLCGLVESDVQIHTLSGMVADYRSKFSQTVETYLANDSQFLYYNHQCHLAFDIDRIEPVQMHNYVSPPMSSVDGSEFNLPLTENLRAHRSRDQVTFQFEIESAKKMPYGFAIWGDHIGLELHQSNAESVSWIGNRLLLVRTDLNTGKNDIEIVLTI